MRKLNINGEDWTTLDEVGYAVHETRRIIEKWKDKVDYTPEMVLDKFVRILFDEEYMGATDEERKYILEFPGEYVVCRRIKTDSGYTTEYFYDYDGYEEKIPVFTKDGERAERFFYESDAQQAAEKCGEGWTVADIGNASRRRVNHELKMLRAILDRAKKMNNEVDCDTCEGDNCEDCVNCNDCEMEDKEDGEGKGYDA